MSTNNRQRPAYLGNKTDPQLAKVKIMLKWNCGYQEEYSVNELLAQGHLGFHSIQEIADLAGDSWKVPDSIKSPYFDVEWAFLTELDDVIGTPEEESETQDQESDFSYELRAEAFARGGMQGVNDLYCASETDDGWR